MELKQGWVVGKDGLIYDEKGHFVYTGVSPLHEDEDEDEDEDGLTKVDDTPTS